MNELQKIEPRSGIEARREILAIPNVIQALSYTDRRMIEASTKDVIADMSDGELVSKIAILSRYITKDAGIKNVSDYDVSRFMNILQTYYSSLTLAEVRMAFELAMAGELDEYLPTDRDGRGDSNHYQSFNVAYITKILNAYKKKRQDAEHKAYTSMPQKSVISDEAKSFYRKEWNKSVLMCCYYYKYRGELPDNVNVYLMYDNLDRLGLSEPINVTDSDLRTATARMLRKAQSGVIKDFVAECIRHQQSKHSDVISEAGLVAKERALMKSLERIAREEIQITDYIKI